MTCALPCDGSSDRSVCVAAIAFPLSSNTVATTDATLSFSASEGGASFLCRLDGGAYSPCVSPVSYAGLTQGAHTFDVYAVDGASNADLTAASRTHSRLRKIFPTEIRLRLF